ncbi:MAG: hypothetical protein WCK59_01765 [Candidatus Falkowbacteria bacterium]
MEGRTHYEKIIGGTSEDKEIASGELQTAFEEQDTRLAEYEIKKSPEDLEIIKKTESLVDKFVLKYGGDPKPLPADNIYILKPDSVLEISHGKISGGIFKPLVLKIGVEQQKSKLLFVSILAHELFHLKSYKSARFGQSNEDIRLYRSGLSMIDLKNQSEEGGEEKRYFDDLEEAIVAECTKKIVDEISKDEEFREEMKAVVKLRDWHSAYYGISSEEAIGSGSEIKYIVNPQDKVADVLAFSDNEESRQAYAAGMIDYAYEEGDAEIVERQREREKLYKLLDNLITGSGGKLKNREEVFDEFARANFSGNYLPLARMVEDILGKGSFRKLAEEFSNESSKEDDENLPDN